ncbi:MAG: D-alanyl-D-alanine carboxypeptidase [Lachnospiraceae bacterium]|nr:D-alanyl-D-alanine carboxypeptidase [Lachnospiraceae bacterium]
MRQIEQAKDVSKTEQLHAGRTICNTGIASHAWNKGKAAYKGWKAPAALAAMALCVTLACGCGEPEKIENAYDITESTKSYGLSSENSETSQSFFAEDIAVAGNENKPLANVTDSLSQAAALFDLTEDTMLFGKNIHERLYPASTTKILTAYVALKHGDLAATATVTDAELQLEAGSSTCGLKTGETLTLQELLYGLILCSGNDAANVIADLVSGSTEEFTKLMNQEAKKLGATNSNFVNPHGLQDEQHYTTVYDMYLIFQAAMQNEEFEKIISSTEHTCQFTSPSGASSTKDWKTTNKFLNGEKQQPEGVQVIGGKTGTTSDAGSCLVLYSKKGEKPYISIVFKADNPDNLYQEMEEMLKAI